MRTLKTQEFGTIQIRQLPLPENIIPTQGIFTYSGRVAVPYRVPGEDADRLHIATVNDDGSGWHEIFDGPAPLKPLGNGLRFMPFPDNKRALLGDYVFECEPDMDSADPAKSRIVPIHYPEALSSMPMLWKVWSEIIIAPDNEHMAWNGLGALAGAYIGTLCRKETEYVLENVRTISGGETLPDPEHEGCILLPPVRGGEVKQFIRGGLGISFVGMDRGAGDSMVQALDSEDVHSITKTPGYDETTIFSPDNRLGMVMSTRFSPKTSNAYIGLIPRRGNMAVKSNVINCIYMQAVSAVRRGKAGNIGPALIDLARSQNEPGYMGVNLSDPDGEWVYCSPMSWHPSGKKALWNEEQKKNIGSAARLSIVELPEYEPGEPVPAARVPEHIPYAADGVSLTGAASSVQTGAFKIAGKHSGFALTERLPQSHSSCKTTYVNFSDDGKSFLNGWESVISPGLAVVGDTVYDAKMEMTGENSGEMDVHVVYRWPAAAASVEIDPSSHGFARYNGETVHIADMIEG